MKKIWIILTTLAVSFIAMASVTTVSAAKPNYIITTDATYPPFDFQDSNNQYTGIDQEILKTIAKREERLIINLVLHGQ